MASVIAMAVIVILFYPPIRYFQGLLNNYIAARKTGLRIVIVPCNLTNPLWLLLGPFFNAAEKFLTGGNNYLLPYGYNGWEKEARSRIHVEKGDAIMFVTPGKNFLYLADAKAINHVYQTERKGDFYKPREVSEPLGIFGPNLGTADGANWQRHRRATAGSFNEVTNKVVWDESLRQARQLLEHWLSLGAKGANMPTDDGRRLALNVLMCASYGRRYDYQPPSSSSLSSSSSSSPTPKRAKPSSKDKEKPIMDYRESLFLILQNCVMVVALGPRLLEKLGFLHSKLSIVNHAVQSFNHHLDMLYRESKSACEAGSEPSTSLMGHLIRASSKEDLLSHEEVRGNMFVYAFAGHDTTAHSLAYSWVLMAAHPEVQEWVREEMRRVLPNGTGEDWDYEAFSQLKRTLAIQYETLRLLNPVYGVLKSGHKTSPVELPLSDGRTITLPADTHVSINTNAVQAYPKYWGEDAEEWRPSRWIETDEKGEERFVTPVKGSYLGWSDGLRACPGKKFSNLEHVAAMAVMYRDHASLPVLEEGETLEAGRKRLGAVAMDAAPVLIMEMKHPERAWVKWEKLV